MALNAPQRESLSPRKRRFLEEAEGAAPHRERWLERNRYYHRSDYAYLRFLVPEGLRVLDLGCGTGRLLAELRPSHGVGVDLSPAMVAQGRATHPHLEFLQGDVEDPELVARLAPAGPFDVIVLADTLGYLDDCLNSLAALHPLCTPDTRVVIAYHSHLWEPLLALGQRLGMRAPVKGINWLSMDNIADILALAGFQVVKREWRLLSPFRLLGLGSLLNRFLAPLPLIRRLCLRNYLVARPLAPCAPPAPLSCTVVIPCRNERGNIQAAVERLPRFCPDLEILFVEGHSGDGTWEEVLRVREAYPHLAITAMRQSGKGKGNAVHEAFAVAKGEVLMILDADLTVPPEALPTFYRLLASGAGEFINGSRFVYPMEDEAMRFLNYWANRTFAAIFSYLLNQRFTDTLCGTKVLTRRSYERVVAGRAFFGDFDPFGDFDLIFGAAKLNLKVVEVPVRYASRRYGTTQISRFQHGWLLLRMVVFAFRKLKML